MRTQRAHYGCGTVFSAAVSSGVPALEMLAVKKWQRTWMGSWREEGWEQIWRKCGDKDGELLASKSRKKKKERQSGWHGAASDGRGWKEQQKLKVRVQEASVGETAAAPNRLRVHHQTIPTREGDRTRNTNKWTEPPVKGKTQTTESLHIYLHAHTHTRVRISCMNSPLVCSRAERDSSVSLSATTSVISATAPAWKHTYTEATVSTNLFICLGGMRFFYVHTVLFFLFIYF